VHYLSSEVCVGDHLLRGFARVAWSPDGKRVGYIKFRQVSDKFEFSMETRDLSGGSPTVLVTGTLLRDFCWLPDGRLVYSMGEGGLSALDHSNLWEALVNAATGAPVGPARRLTNWAGSNLDHLNATSDGKRGHSRMVGSLQRTRR
jgi:hypothetical protein